MSSLARTAFPERADRPTSAPDAWALRLLGRLRRRLAPPAAREVTRLGELLQRRQPELRALDDAALLARLRTLARPAVRELQADALREALVATAELSRRAMGLTPYPTQLFGAMTLIRGQLAEMQTGEGKTLTAGLAACLAGLAGLPVHVVTVNDYLAGRDADKNRPLFGAAGLTVGVVAHGVERPERVRAYACDIAYCTNKELVFDYLRDRVAQGGRAGAAQLRARRLARGTQGLPADTVLRGLHFAIVDEADSIFIDEARTPLILAVEAGDVPHAEAYAQALGLVAGFERGRHFRIDEARRELHLTDAGVQALADATAGLGGPWGAAHQRGHLGTQALRALHLFRRDEHYLVDAEGEVQIIDEYTGRVLPGRTWEQGLHQMIEAKEGVELSPQTATQARITYQRFFCRYLRLAGMSGTAREMVAEFAAVFRLATVTVPTHRPSARVSLPPRLLPDEAAKWAAVADFVAERHRAGQPVLVGTRSVLSSERLGELLQARGLAHRVLNARQDAEEAAIVAVAGERGAVTVATNMAGRGTDIGLGPGVAELGGLCVVLTEYHESPRIDRQLVGRCARQGDPGTAVAIVALDDELLRQHGGHEARLLAWAEAAGAAGVGRLLQRARVAAQRRAERMHARTRRETMRQDERIDRMTAFSGDPT
ncbi:prepilin peptidase [Roseateles sp. BYS78W]|uniref:Protein translocase subunit SecA n=1 Tax=Pelomonas candidula TaxID=3299025 RepID=A0ABW7HGP0_9BURK